MARTDSAQVTLSTNVHAKIRVRELIVDFLGSLVPGVAFTTALFPVLVFPGHALLQVLGNMQEGLPFSLLGKAPDSALFHMGMFGIFLVVSYIVGNLFFRQDPKIPDIRSYARAARHKTYDGPVERQPGKDEPQVEFPYSHLFEFLKKRGLDYLARHVPWRGNDPRKLARRSKHFINALKIRLEFSFPENYGTIARNEAHIRLMTSMWYASKLLLYLSLAGLAAGLIAAWHAGGESGNWYNPQTSVVVLPLGVMALCWLGKLGIERSLHYQRVREAVFVLETAHWASKQNRRLFDGLDSPSARRATAPRLRR
jgi:hypothetical protein